MRTIFIILFLGSMNFLACGGPDPRKPVEVHSGSFISESVARNKELLAREEEQINQIMAEDSLNTYQATASGSWYYYNQKIEAEAPTPEAGDEVSLQLDILSLENDTIYSAADIGTMNYLIDKEDKDRIFPGLRNAIKLLKVGETATFLFPSSLAYGYLGDKEKIGPNVPIRARVSLLYLEKQQDSIKN